MFCDSNYMYNTNVIRRFKSRANKKKHQNSSTQKKNTVGFINTCEISLPSSIFILNACPKYVSISFLHLHWHNLRNAWRLFGHVIVIVFVYSLKIFINGMVLHWEVTSIDIDLNEFVSGAGACGKLEFIFKKKNDAANKLTIISICWKKKVSPKRIF